MKEIAKTLLAASLLSISAQNAMAFGAGSDHFKFISIGDQNNCTVFVYYKNANRTRMSVSALGVKDISGLSFDTSISQNAIARPHGPVTQSHLQHCFSTPVSNFNARLDSSTFASATYLGFTFTTDGKDYEIALKGQDGRLTETAVPEGQNHNAHGNTSPAEVKKATKEKIHTVMQNRTAQILSHQPSISGFMDGSNLSGGGPLGALNVSANPGSMNLAFSSSLSRLQAARANAQNETNALVALDQMTASDHASSYAAPTTNAASSAAVEALDSIDAGTKTKDSEGMAHFVPKNRFDVWTQIYGSRTRLDQAKADAFVGFLGAHYFVNENLILGAMAQYDTVAQKNGTSKTDGTGWMAGPYVAGRLPGHSLLYEARFAWGQSNNKITPTGSAQDHFDTTRWMATGQLKGDITISNLDQMTRIALNPFLRATYFEEKQHAYTDSNGNLIDAQSYAVGQLGFGPKITLDKILQNGMRISPFISASGLWDFKMTSNDSGSSQPLKEGNLRARFDAGLGIQTSTGWLLDFSSFYDGLGVKNYESYGGKARLTISLN